MNRKLTVLALAPLLLAAGCNSTHGTGGSGTAAAPPVTVSSAPPSTPSEVPPVSPTPPTGSSTAPGKPSTATSQPTRCRVADLKVTQQGSPGGGAAGSMYTWLVFRNVSGRTCTLSGYPGVSWVAPGSGQQVNEPMRRATATTAPRVVLAAGAVGHAVVQEGHPEALEPQCREVPVAGFRVYPPGETASVFVALPHKACSARGVGSAAVSPVFAGLSE
jgi:hypothetical protein